MGAGCLLVRAAWRSAAPPPATTLGIGRVFPLMVNYQFPIFRPPDGDVGSRICIQRRRRKVRMVGLPEYLGRNALLAGVCTILAGCATYEVQPLDLTPHLARSLSDLKTTAAEATQPAVDIAKPLGFAEIAFLAVENNPTSSGRATSVASPRRSS